MGSLASHSISRIAIIGAGPSGISCAKYLLAEKTFEKIDIFEQRWKVGGVWNLTSNVQSFHTPVPQLDPNFEQGVRPLAARTHEATGHAGANGEKTYDNTHGQFVDETPMYETLETNIPKQLMQYAEKPFDDQLPVFPGHESVLKYCNEYAQEVKRLIHFGCQVLDVRPVRHSSENEKDNSFSWSVTIADKSSLKATSYEYDAVVVASGHYNVPSIPDIQGLQRWSKAYPTSVLHSKAYRHPATFTGKKVIIVGNSASGTDIGAQVGQFCRLPLLQSSRSSSIFLSPGGNKTWKEDIPEIVEFLNPQAHDRGVRLADGRVEDKIDIVLFATGYFYSFPFLHLDRPVISTGSRTKDVYQQIFHIDLPTLAFPLLTQKVIPFPFVENQAAVIARVWSGRLSLPSKREMRAWEAKMLADRGDGKAMHVLNFPQDADHLNILYDWAASASPRLPGLENEGRGKLGTRWGDKQRWTRSQFPAIRKAFVERGEARYGVRTIEELGFNYGEFIREQVRSSE